MQKRETLYANVQLKAAKYMNRMQVVVSACLLGERCKWSGGSNTNEEFVGLLRERGFDVVPVCPEVAGGLSVPREPAELLSSGRVVTRCGADVTDAFNRGVDACMKKLDEAGCCPWCTACVLQPRSPSCGKGFVYDGTFNGNLVRGDGLFVQRLKRAGYSVMTPEEFIAAN